MSNTKEKLPSENGPGAGFKGIKSGTENNTRGTTRVEVGEPKGNQARQMRAVDGSESMATNRNPLHGSDPKKDKYGDTRNSFHPKHGR
jgi:hypothetical protein